MKKKLLRVISFLSLISLIFSAKAQNYIPLPLQNCYWLIYPSSGTYNPNTMATCVYNDIYKIAPQGDTLIGAKTYVKFYSYYMGGSGTNVAPPCNPYTAPTTTISYFYAVRQDTTARKLYMVRPNTTTEKLMFDFTQGVGDTVKAESGAFGSVPPGGTTQFRIIDSVYYRSYSDGQCHKVYKLKPFANGVGLTANTEIVEGFGNETGLEQRIKYASMSGNSQAYGNAKLVVNSATISIVTPNICQGVRLPEYKLNDISIFPNPSSDMVQIRMPLTNAALITLYSSAGQEVKVLKVDNAADYDLNIKNLPEGSYYLKISSGSHTYFKKIMKVNP